MLQAGPGCELALPPLCPVQPRSGQGRPVGPGLCACEEMSPSGAEAQRVMFRPEPWWPSERSLLRVSRVPLLPAAPSPGQPGARSPLTMPKASWRAILHPQDTGEEGFLEPRAPCVSVCAHAGVCHRTLAHAPPLGTSPRPPSVRLLPPVCSGPASSGTPTLVTLLQRQHNHGHLSPSPGQPLLASSIYHLPTHQTILNFYLLFLSALDL